MECTLGIPQLAVSLSMLPTASSTFCAPSSSGQSASCWIFGRLSGAPVQNKHRVHGKVTQARLLSSFGKRQCRGPDRLWHNAGLLEVAIATGVLRSPAVAWAEELVPGSAVVDEAGTAAGLPLGEALVQDGGTATAVEAGSSASLGGGVAAGPAWEQVAEKVSTGETGDLVDALASGTVTLLFVLAFLALVGLTVGVIYLTVAEFRERKEAESDKKQAPVKKPLEPDADKFVSGKGFGKKVEKSRR